jgi:hypothetical protein
LTKGGDNADVSFIRALECPFERSTFPRPKWTCCWPSATGNFFQAKLPKALSWTAPPENFSSMMAIFAGHYLAALFAVVGQPADLPALTVNQFSEIMIIETGEKIKTTNPDEVVVTGTLVSGGVFKTA